MNDLPSYDDLPRSELGMPQAWHLFGADDNVGMLNLQTPRGVVDAATLIRKGSVFPLNAPLDLFSPSLATYRSPPRHHAVVHETPTVLVSDDVLDNFFPQASSQWDALGHCGADAHSFYNGATASDVRLGRRNGIDHWARRGIAGRAVVLDLAAGQSDYDPVTSHAFTVDDLERARTAAGLEYRPGDVIILNTGFAERYAELDARQKMMLAGAETTPGIERSEDMCRYLWNAHPSAIVSDTYAVEEFPAEYGPNAKPFGFLHPVLIGGFGFALGELWWLADLVADCRGDGVYECFLTSAPLNVPGGIGSTANALAIK
jgi:kynurenine formamidase